VNWNHYLVAGNIKLDHCIDVDILDYEYSTIIALCTINEMWRSNFNKQLTWTPKSRTTSTSSSTWVFRTLYYYYMLLLLLPSTFAIIVPCAVWLNDRRDVSQLISLFITRQLPLPSFCHPSAELFCIATQNVYGSHWSAQQLLRRPRHHNGLPPRLLTRDERECAIRCWLIPSPSTMHCYEWPERIVMEVAVQTKGQNPLHQFPRSKSVTSSAH